MIKLQWGEIDLGRSEWRLAASFFPQAAMDSITRPWLYGRIYKEFVEQAADVESDLADLVKAGYPTKLDDLLSQDSEGVNSAPFIAEAIRLGRGPNLGSVPLLSSAELLGLSEKFELHKSWMDLMEKASQGDFYAPTRDWVPLCSVVFDDLQTLQDGVNALATRGMSRAASGDVEGALTDIRSSLKLAERGREEPFLLHYLVSLACVTLSDRAVHRIATLWEGDQAKLIRLRDLVAEVRPTRELRRAIQGEFLFSLDTARNLKSFGGKFGVRVFSNPKDVRSDGLPEGVIRRGLLAPVLRFSKEWDRWLLADLGEEEQMAKGFEIFERIMATGSPTNRLLEDHRNTFFDAGAASAREPARRDVLLAFIDVLIYRAQAGRTPTEEEAVELLPILQNSRRRVTYSRTDEGFVLSSSPSNAGQNKGEEGSPDRRDKPLIFAFPLPDRKR